MTSYVEFNFCMRRFGCLVLLGLRRGTGYLLATLFACCLVFSCCSTSWFKKIHPFRAHLNCTALLQKSWCSLPFSACYCVGQVEEASCSSWALLLVRKSWHHEKEEWHLFCKDGSPLAKNHSRLRSDPVKTLRKSPKSLGSPRMQFAR